MMIELRQRNVSFSEKGNKEVFKSKLKHQMQTLPSPFFMKKQGLLKI